MNKIIFLTLLFCALESCTFEDSRSIASECPIREENESAFIYNMGLSKEFQHCKIIEKSEGLTIKIKKIKPHESKAVSEIIDEVNEN